MYESKEELVMKLQNDLKGFETTFKTLTEQIMSLTEQLKMLETERTKVAGKHEYCLSIAQELLMEEPVNVTDFANIEKPTKSKGK